METCNLHTPAHGFISITHLVQKAVAENGLKNGAVLVYCPHTTAAVTINENADPDVTSDLSFAFTHFFPDMPQYRHTEGNSAAHLKASLVGPSVTVPVQNGYLALGTWQGIYFCEFDGPRNRHFYVQCLTA